MSVGRIGPELARASLPREGPEAKESGFAEALARLVREANADQLAAARAMERLLVHGEGSVHEAMIAMTRAEGSFRLLMEMRNRAVEALQRLLDLQV